MREVKGKWLEKEKTLIQRKPGDNRYCSSHYHNGMPDIFDIL